MKTSKIHTNYIIQQYETGIHNYSKYTTEVGLWESEKQTFQQYIKPNDAILDMGCGTGRTTFGLYNLGYKNIVGVDLTPGMIDEAKKLNAHFGTKIPFLIGDATQIEYKDGLFDAAIFSFNGMMAIPTAAKREQAVREISRVLKKDGVFIFTAYCREDNPDFFEFWKEETERWETGQQNAAVYEFGDLIMPSKNEEREIFIHISTQKDLIALIENGGFSLVDTFIRSERFVEAAAVTNQSGDCRFWVVKKSFAQ